MGHDLFPTPTATLPLITAITRAAPLPTAWSPPPSCATPTLRSWAGNCISNTCSIPTTTLPLGPLLWANWPYQVSRGVWTSTECLPPGWNDLAIFAFSPATGCPSGYTAATTETYKYASGYNVVTCCPSAYTLSGIASGTSIVAGSCESMHKVTAGETYLDVAYGMNTDGVRMVMNGGETVTDTWQWSTESFIRTATATAATTVAVFHPQVRVLLEAAPPVAGTAAAGFTLWGLNPIFTIVALVGIGLGVLILLCCGCYCCCRDPRPKPDRPAPHRPAAWNCKHGRSSTCSSKTYISDSTCCACRDWKRPPMTIASRTSSYCVSCKTFWAECLAADVPNEWKSGTDDDPIIAELLLRIMEQGKCSHGLVAVGCDRNPTGSKKCCACTDTRRWQMLTKEERVRTYCRECAEYYRANKAEDCPTEWRLADIQCSHARSKACGRSAKFETKCCVCNDTRTGTMPRQDRTAMFCKACASHWNSVPVYSLPASWGIRCSHGETVYQQCRTHSSQGTCCACVDTSPGSSFPTKAARLQSRYCSSCIAHWTDTADESCPRTWGLKCPHNRAFAWSRLTIPPAVVAGGSRAAPDTGTGVCCCACRDKTPAGTRIPKVQRIKDYCFACKYHWASIPDSACPEEWVLGCRHGGMAARCLSSWASPSQNANARYSAGPSPISNRNSLGSLGAPCCACQDTRTKNMPKQTRTRTYCIPCRTTWNAWPDAQCPPEWGLLRPRTDCAHSMALECTTSKAGEAVCCACRDGRKFLPLQQRLESGYCAPCKQRWEKGESVPPSWLISMKDLPLRKTMPVDGKDRCLRPVTVYLSESIRSTHRRLFDQGPRYGEPRFGGVQDEDDVQKGLNSNPISRTGANAAQQPGQGRQVGDNKPPAKKLDLLVGNFSIKVEMPPSPPDAASVSYEGYEFKGPTRNPYGPRFSVPVVNALASASPLVSSETSAGKKRTPEVGGRRASARLSEAENRRREERMGLCVGRQPKFAVPANS